MRESQHPTELAFLCEKAKGKKSFLEIGSRYGETLWAIGKVLAPKSRIVAVDLPNGPWGRQNSNIVLERVCNGLREMGHNVSLILNDSRDHRVINLVYDWGPYDFVFIDGDHRYNGVKADWENYGPMAAEMVAFHDVAAKMIVSGTGDLMEVPRLWNEIKDSHPHEVCIGKNSPMGVGVIYK